LHWHLPRIRLPARRRLHAALIGLVRNRRAAAAVEFALVGTAQFLFMLAIVNLGMLGFTVGALVRGVQSAARAAAVQTANTYATTEVVTCPTQSAIIGYFNNYADPPLPPATGSTGNPSVTATWSNNGGDANTSEPPGVYLTLTASYHWVPVGFAAFGAGINLKMTTVATVSGTAQAASTC
jgi:Flp pilus assembly protein TadG